MKFLLVFFRVRSKTCIRSGGGIMGIARCILPPAGLPAAQALTVPPKAPPEPIAAIAAIAATAAIIRAKRRGAAAARFRVSRKKAALTLISFSFMPPKPVNASD
jgi:hypothetical protein